MGSGKQHLVTLADVEEARARLDGIVRPTPIERSDTLSRLTGRSVLLKPEHLQRTGSFKIRGAYNLISRLPPNVEVVAGSAGNHAQGVALAATLTGRRSTIFMPVTAPLPKVEATRAYGSDVRLEGRVVDDCVALGRDYAEETGATFVPPFDDPLIIAGQGTVGAEIAEQAEDASCVVVPVGGGGLISGIAAALREVRPQGRIVGVQAEGASGVAASLQAGRVVWPDDVSTLADGIAVKAPSQLTLDHIQSLVDAVVTVTDDEISTAVLLLLERAKAVVEPAGAAALAALLAGKIAGTDPAVAVLSGGNVDPLLLTKLIHHGLSAAGRYLVLRIVLDDRPGALASVTDAVAQLGLNVVDVEHHRSGAIVAVDEVEVLLTLETRDPSHREEVVTALRDQGFRVELVR